MTPRGWAGSPGCVYQPTWLQENMAVVSDEARIRELAEAIRSKCAQAQQMKQQTSSTSVSTGNMQVLSM